MFVHKSMQRFMIFGLLGLMFLLLPVSALANGAGIPTGTYGTVITESDLPPGLPPEAVAILVASWTNVFNSDRTFEVYRDGELSVSGEYVSNPSRLILFKETGDLACTGPGLGTGIYDWSLNGEDLVLSAVQDHCFGRLTALSTHPLDKQ